jgi:hypothetical protein
MPGLTVPKLQQIQNFVSRQKAKNGDSLPLTLHELQEFCTLNSAEPADQTTSFIVRFDILSAEQFIIVWSSKKLLQMQKESPVICVDATYKILSFGYPILVLFYDYLNKPLIIT